MSCRVSTRVKRRSAILRERDHPPVRRRRQVEQLEEQPHITNTTSTSDSGVDDLVDRVTNAVFEKLQTHLNENSATGKGTYRKGQNIAILEFYTIVLSLLLWGDKIRDKCLTIFTDNEALVHVINKSTCKDTTLMIFVCKLVLVCLRQNILFKAKHISGFKNTLADALSRLQIPRFKKLAPAYMDPMPTVIPPHLPAHWPL